MVALALALAMVLQAADAATTFWLLRLGGAELNPVLGWLMGRLGVRGALALKLGLGLGILGYCRQAGFLAGAPWAAAAILALSLLVVANNLLVIRRLRRRAGRPVRAGPGSGIS